MRSPMSHDQDLICPFCFTIYTPGIIDPDMPVCRECNAFGRAVIVESYPEFAQSTPVAQVEMIHKSWQGRAQFLEAERSMILANIEAYLAGLNTNS